MELDRDFCFPTCGRWFVTWESIGMPGFMDYVGWGAGGERPTPEGYDRVCCVVAVVITEDWIS